MLRKLLKHEFRATGRTMLPLYLILLVTAVGANLSTRKLLESGEGLVSLLGGLLIMAFAIAMAAVCIMSVVVMVQRFYKSLLQDEGYVMMTLPVSVHQHVWAKLITSAVWFALTILAVILSCCIMAYEQGAVKWFFRGLADLFHEITTYYAINSAALVLEFLLACFVGCCVMCLEFYAALAVGHSRPNHKMAFSVGAFFVMQFALEFLMGVIGNLLDWTGVMDVFRGFTVNLSGMTTLHVAMLGLTAVSVLVGAVYYGVTVWFLKHKLNLE